MEDEATMKIGKQFLDRSSVESPKHLILEAVQMIESETKDLKNKNTMITQELEKLRMENDALRQQLEQTTLENKTLGIRIQTLDEQNRRLQSDLATAKGALTAEVHRVGETNRLNIRRLEEIENLKEELGRKEAAYRSACQERDTMKTKLEKATRRNFEDCDFELLHQVETLKKECQAVLYSKQVLERSNVKLAAEIDNMAALLADKEVELKNERLRHTLLMSQFNSLIQENSNLKDKNQVRTIPKQQSIPLFDHEGMSDEDNIQIPPTTSGLSTVASRRTSAATRNSINVTSLFARNTRPETNVLRTGSRSFSNKIKTGSARFNGEAMRGGTVLQSRNPVPEADVGSSPSLAKGRSERSGTDQNTTIVPNQFLHRSATYGHLSHTPTSGVPSKQGSLEFSSRSLEFLQPPSLVLPALYEQATNRRWIPWHICQTFDLQNW